MDDIEEFGFAESFHIDGMELDGLSKQLCFTLGVEWEMVRREIEAGVSFARPIHSENVERVEKLCDAMGVLHYDIVPHDDWPTLMVR